MMVGNSMADEACTTLTLNSLSPILKIENSLPLIVCKVAYSFNDATPRKQIATIAQLAQSEFTCSKSTMKTPE